MHPVLAAANGSWWWWWIAVVVILFLIPLGYGWGYRGYGAPRVPRRRRPVRRGEAGTSVPVRDVPGNEDPWGPLGTFIWVILVIVVVWLIVLWIW